MPESLIERAVTTSLGELRLLGRPDAFASTRPLVVALPGCFAGTEDLGRLPHLVQTLADAVLVRLPGFGGPPLSDPSVQAIARAVGEMVAQLFAARHVVMLGVSIGAVAALGVRAAAVRRVVAVEPPLATGSLWPILSPIQAHLRAQPPGSAAHAAFRAAFGVGVQRREPRDHRWAFDGLKVPADVVLGGVPLQPERRLEGMPSLVGPNERTWLAARPQVRLHVAPRVGHNVPTAAGKLLMDVLLEACRRASAELAYDAGGLDEALVEATPLAARRIAHWGPGGLAFAGACLAWNPRAEVAVLGEGAEAAPEPGAVFDAVALGAPPSRGLLKRLTDALRPGGDLLARWAAPGAADALAAVDLQLGSPVDDAGTGVLRARKTPGHARPPLRLEIVAFADRLMDVRTRLPARGFASDPELAVRYVVPPHTPPELPAAAPKVLVLQRPRPMADEAHRALLARLLARGWLTVIEYDDHPGLVAETLGRPFGPGDMDRFGWFHAVQTTVEPLAELFRQANPEVRLLPNAVYELAPFPQDPPRRRIFYGAVSRGPLGVEVARSLAPVTAAYPDAEFVVLGDRAVFEALPTANKSFEEYLPYEAYLARMAGCLVSLSPVAADATRAAKSDAKFLDAARAGVVTIGSPVIYGRTIRHGKNGLLAERAQDWAPRLAEALADPAATRAIGRRAWEEVRSGRMFADQVAPYREWLFGLWARRAELEAALFARMPGLAEAVAAERAGLARGADGG